MARQSGKSMVYQDMHEAEYEATLLENGLPDGMAAILANSDAGASKGGLFDSERQSSCLDERSARPGGSLRGPGPIGGTKPSSTGTSNSHCWPPIAQVGEALGPDLIARKPLFDQGRSR